MVASTPPATRPMNWPAIAAIPLIPRARPRWLDGNASVRMAAELANRKAPPTPCTMRIRMIQSAPLEPVKGVAASRSEPPVKITNPALYMRTRPYRSPSHPNATTSTAVTSR